MPLTTEQLQTLKTDILADPILNAFPNNSDGAFEIAKAYNLLANPAYIVWKTNVSTAEIRAVLVWSEFDALSVSKQNAFTFLCSNHVVNAALANVRQGISSIFTGPGQAGNLAALIDIAKRSATRAEKLFATGTGTTASPAVMTIEGPISLQDVEAARRLP